MRSTDDTERDNRKITNTMINHNGMYDVRLRYTGRVSNHTHDNERFGGPQGRKIPVLPPYIQIKLMYVRV